ncbi:MAG: PD-(D/E)XK nuclease family protein [Acidimicrobiales bacterium]|nr:PD-(D/E)XK nuclease family protein [Acidimicrobiales bacterium]
MSGAGGVPRLIVVPFGLAPVALASCIRAGKAPDPLGPVTVVVPATPSAVTLRRWLGRQAGGLANVRLISLPQLAAELGAPVLAHAGRPPLPRAVEEAAIRTELGHAGGWLGRIPPGLPTVRAVEALLAELRLLTQSAEAEVAASGARAREVIELFARVRERCAGYADEREVLQAAIAAVDAGQRSVTDAGLVIVYLPRELRPLEIELVRALHRRELVSVIVGELGDELAAATSDPSVAPDVELYGLLNVLEPVLGPPQRCTEEPAVVASGSVSVDGATAEGEPLVIVRAPDPDEEVRVATRIVLDALAAGTPPEAIALGFRVSDPYLGLLHEQLDAAGIPHHCAAATPLAQSIAGRTLLGFLRVVERSFARSELFRWLRSAPTSFARRGPLDAWERRSREAGIGNGAEQWHERLASARERLLQELDVLRSTFQSTPTDRSARDIERIERRLEVIDSLDALVSDLFAQAHSALSAATWSELATWSRAFLDQALGPPDRLAEFGVLAAEEREREVAAYERVLEVLGALAELEEFEPAVEFDVFFQVLAAELEAPGVPHGVLGRGVFAGPLRDLAGAPYALVVVLGMGEGVFPPRGQDDPILPERFRETCRALPSRRPSRASELRDLAAAVAGARRRVYSCSKADTRASRERMPSRWLLAEIGRRLGRPPSDPVKTGELDGLAAPWFLDIPSFEWWPRNRGLAATPAEAFLVASFRQSERVAVVPSGATRLRRGFEAVLARRHGVFGEWLGHIGPRPELRFDQLRVGSATAFEDWAGCPFRYFLRRVLEVRSLDERSEADSISSLDRGSLIHEILERFVRDELEDGSSDELGASDLDRLRGLAARIGDEFRDSGKTGRPLLWALESDKLLRRLERIMWEDLEHRRSRGVRPVAVELGFGTGEGDVGPVVIRLDSDRAVAFRGKIDRVDRSMSGDRLVVIDYKTGKASSGYDELRADRDGDRPRDIVCRGRHLQLAIYALAARSAFGDLPVSAFFWFVDQSGKNAFLGGEIDEFAEQRLREVLGVIVDGIENGCFPARPGDEEYFSGFVNCGFCEFDRLCSNRRAEQWEKVRWHPALERYRELAEGALP